MCLRENGPKCCTYCSCNLSRHNNIIVFVTDFILFFFILFKIALLDSPTALSMEEKLQQNEARVSVLASPARLLPLQTFMYHLFEEPFERRCKMWVWTVVEIVLNLGECFKGWMHPHVRHEKDTLDI